MRKIVASLLVPVALISTAASAFGTPANIRPVAGNGAETSQTTVATSSDGRKYWIESNFDYDDSAEVRPASASAGRPVRRVLLTGYHPVEGFAVEMASNRAAYASAGSAFERGGSSRARGFGPRLMMR